MRETELYAPIKAFLEGQGYEVKAEIGPCDVMACRNNEAPVIVELKTGFSLSLFHQAIARQSVTDAVYIAVPKGSGRAWNAAVKRNTMLCRRLGLGLIVVRTEDGHVDVRCDPAPYTPRKSAIRKVRMLREFARRSGDPNTGGTTRARLVTAYRQDALRIAREMATRETATGAEIARATGISKARQIMYDNHYGWFERLGKGRYALTAGGRKALENIE